MMDKNIIAEQLLEEVGLRPSDTARLPEFRDMRLSLALMLYGGIRPAAGYCGAWVPDVCRHTFASYHAAYFRNLSELQLEMGHRDTSPLRSRYMMPTLKKEAAAFWKAAGVGP